MMMRNDAGFLSNVIPPNFMRAAGVSAKDKSEFPNFFDYLSVFKRLHAATITGTEKETSWERLSNLRGIVRYSFL